MRNWFTRRPLFARLWEILHRSAPRRDHAIGTLRKRPGLERLEDRLAPASLTDSSGALTIHLDIPGETVTLTANATAHHYTLSSSTNSLFNAGLTGATYTGTATTGTLALTSDSSIAIVDNTAHTSVTFGNSGASSYQDQFTVTLSNPLAGGVSFRGASTFTNDLNVTLSHGDISSVAGSAVSVTNVGSLTLQTPGNIALSGSVNVAGTTTLEANGAISATTASNNLGSNLNLEGVFSGFGSAAASASVVSTAALELDTVNVSGVLNVKAGGAITEGFAGLTVGGTAGFTTTSGAIALDNGNAFTGAVSAQVSASGSDNITLGNDNFTTSGLVVGTIVMGTGILQLDNFSTNFFPIPSITQTSTGGIFTGGDVMVDLSSFGSENVLLNTAPNNIAGMFDINGDFQQGDLAFRNTNSGASASNIAVNSFTIDNLTLQFDNAAITIDTTQPVFAGLIGFNANALTLIAGSDITEVAGGFTENGNASFTSKGGNVNLDDPGNTFGDTISASVNGSNNITLGNANGSTTLGTITLGTGNLQVDDFDNTFASTITEDPLAGGITMTGSPATATFNIVNDSFATVDLGLAKNDFALGVSVIVNGAPSTGEIDFRNSDTNASLGQLQLNNFTVTNLTVYFDLASINVSSLPAFSTSGNLSVTAGGNITESSGGISTSGTATFAVLGNTSSITLGTSNALNGTVFFSTPATDTTGIVSLTNVVGVSLGDASLGKGTFSVTATTGDITEAGTITQAPGASAATFTATAGNVIDLATGASQNLFTGQVVLAGSAVTTVSVEDYNPTANLGSVTLPAGPLQSVSLIFDNPVASILLPPTSSFTNDFSLTVTNDIVLPAGSSLSDTGNLSLDSTTGSLDLLGTITVAGATSTTSLTVGPNGGDITATGSGNNFGASLNLTNSAGGSNTVDSANGLALGNVQVEGGSFSNLSVTALHGAITQAVGTSLDLAGNSSFTTSSGAITLTASANLFAGAVSASVAPAGSDTVTIDGNNSGSNLLLGTIALGTGALSVTNTGTSFGDGIAEAAQNGISTVAGSTATLTFTVTSTSAGVVLSGAPNNLPLGVHVDIVAASTGTTGSIGFRNTSPTASMAQLMISPNFTSIVNETYQFDKTAINVDSAVNIAGTLSLTAGGAITQAAGITAVGGSFSVLNNFGIALNSNANHISGSVSFSDPKGDTTRAVSFANTSSITLGSSTLGLGAFSLTAGGSITQSGSSAITQAPGAGAVTLTAAGSTIDLSGGQNNDFSGPVTFNGSGSNLTTIGFENDDTLASMPRLNNLALTLASATITLDRAPVVLPSFPANTTIGTLSVTSGGNIIQQAAASAALTVTGEATFDATGNSAILLGNTLNSFSKVHLSNSGENAVTLFTTGALTIDNWQLGSGPVSVTANGAVTEADGDTGLQQVLGSNDAVAGSVTLSAGANPILLDNSNNLVLGPLSVTATGGTGNVTIVNNASLVLANDTVGGGLSLNVGAFFAGISQAPGTDIAVTGNAFFSAGENGAVTLTNANNTIGGMISLNTGGFEGGNAALSVSGSALLEGSSVDGLLSVSAGGTISQLPGSAGSNNDGVLIAIGGANFTAGAGDNITLSNSGNDFGDSPVALNTSGAGGVSLTDSDPSGLTLGSVAFGSGGLTIVATASLTQDATFSGASSTIVGSGAVSITGTNLISVNLSSTGNDFTGSIALNNIGNLTIDNQGNIALTGSSTIAPTADVTLVAGGSVSLPNGTAGTLTLDSLNVSANQSTVATNLTTTNANEPGLSFTGAVTFSMPAALTATSGNISFNGNVTSTQALTFNLSGPGTSVTFFGGTWNQGANNLTVTGAGAEFGIGSFSSPGVFSMSGGTLTLTGETLGMTGPGAPSVGNEVLVNFGSTFKVSNSVTLSDGGTDSIVQLNFDGSTFQAGLGASSGSLTLSGLNPTDQISISGARLSGFGGLAGTTAQPILSISGGGSIVGSFANPSDSSGNFLMGTDIVQATYATHSVSVIEGGTAAASGTVSGSESDGDGYKIALTGGSGLVVFTPSGSGAEVVVRNASSASTLTITTTKNGGDGFTAVRDIVFDGSGAATIAAGTTNVTGNITLAGPLAALTLNNWTSGTLSSGGASTTPSTITANLLGGLTINLPTTLSKLTAASVGSIGQESSPASITAAAFGTITVNGNAAQHVVGNFAATLINTTPGVAVSSATIAGTLSGNWELTGSVGSVTVTTATTNWNLGVPNGPGIFNAGALTSVSSLSLGTASFVTTLASGSISSLTAISLNDWLGSSEPVQGVLQAGSFGTIKTTGSAKTTPLDHGNLIANITATSNSGGSALNLLSVAGNLGTTGSAGSNPVESTLLFANGNIGSIMVGRSIEQVTLDAMTTTAGGAITTLQAGQVNDSIIDAKTLSTLKVVGNLSAQLFGDFLNSSLTITGTPNMTTAALGTFQTALDVVSSDIIVENGGLTTFAVGLSGTTNVGRISSDTITLDSATAGNLGTISAAEWDSTDLTARTIGTIKVTGRPATGASTPAFNGDLTGSTIIAFEPVGQTTPGITTVSVAGELTSFNSGSGGSNFLLADNGIGTATAGTGLSVGRNVSDYQISTDLDGGTGAISSITAGEWDSSDLSAFSLGPVNIKGFATPETSSAFTNGDFTNSDVVIGGNLSTTPAQGIKSLTVANSLTSSNFNVPSGIGTVAVTGQVVNDQLNLLNPLSPTSGALGSFSAGNVQQLTLDANTAGTIMTVVPKLNPAGLTGNVAGSTLSVGFTGTGSSALVGVGTFSLAGSLSSSTLEVKDSITTFSVTQQVTGATISAAFDSANPAATIKTLSVGSWSFSSLTANSVSTSFNVAGSMSNATITLLGALSGVALGKFTAGGQVTSSNFQVSSGNVTSFSSAFFIHSNLLLGYAAADPADLTDTANDQTSANWEVPPTAPLSVGTFTTTAIVNPFDVTDTASFADSDVVAGKLGVFSLSVININPGSLHQTFGLGFRTNGGSAGTLTINGASKTTGTPLGSFHYVGLGG